MHLAVAVSHECRRPPPAHVHCPGGEEQQHTQQKQHHYGHAAHAADSWFRCSVRSGHGVALPADFSKHGITQARDVDGAGQSRLALPLAGLLLSSEEMNAGARILFIFLFLVCFSGYISPPVALTGGIVFGLTLAHPFATQTRTLTTILLQSSVVALGFGMNLHEVVKAGRGGFVYTALGIGFALLIGWALGKLLQVQGNTSFLITAGTAICGGSAIVAVGPIVHADDREMAVSLGTVFILNSVALLIFPPIGGTLHLSQTQFGLWAALAIHDTSSVVGAASRYGSTALVVGTTVKLARALWIVPLALGTAAAKRSKSRIVLPWFILFFCLAAVINTYVSAAAALTPWLFTFGRLGLTATLFLIGTGISRSTLREVGWRPLSLGIVLWVVVGAASLYVIRAGLIAL
jgi:uncharacterized integral membrane protein (TIGR00698 family)